MSKPLLEVFRSFDLEQRSNMAILLEVEELDVTVELLVKELTWLYRSRLRESIKSNTESFKHWLAGKLLDAKRSVKQEETVPPSYEDLVFGLAKNLNVYDESASLETTELYVSHAVIIDALKKMSPKQRVKYFEEQADMGLATSIGNYADSGLSGPMRAISGLGVANAAGFSIYGASSTALGFVTHAAGISLPFAAYTGMSQTIAVLIGPVGWLAAGSWLAFGLTEPSWKKLLPIVIFLINNKAVERIERIEFAAN